MVTLPIERRIEFDLVISPVPLRDADSSARLPLGCTGAEGGVGEVGSSDAE